MNYAILIDGGFAKRKLGDAKRTATADDFRRLIDTTADLPALAGQRLHRVYYYDSVPLESSHDKLLGGGTIEFANDPRVARSKQLFLRLSRLPLMALRLGELTFNEWAVNTRKLSKATGDTIELSAATLSLPLLKRA